MNLLDSLHPQPASWLHNSNLSPIVSGYVQRLETLHYSARTIRGYVYCVAHFAYWLRNREVDVQDISESLIHGFLAEHLPHCSCPSPVQRSLHQSRTALRHLLRALPDSGFLVDRRITDPIDDQLELFDRHMLRTMGLASSTRSRRIKIIRSLLRLCVKDNVKAELTPTPESLRIFLAKELTRLSPASAGSITGAVRCFLKFLAFHGASVAHLLPVVVSPAHWRLAPLPQVLSRDEVKQLLDAFAPTLPSNRRGYAMVRCLIDLGLRVKEVTGLELDDIDWSAGTVRIRRGKCRRDDVLPLPPSTGLAIAEYLRSERPSTANRHIFVRHVAPFDEPIKSDVVRNTVRQAYRRCGLPHTRVHMLRNTLASRLLYSGGTLKEVSDILRHRALDTSMIYAKVDLKRLSAVAMPWAGSTP